MPSQKGLWSSYALAGACTLTTAVGVLATQAVRLELQTTKEERDHANETNKYLEARAEEYEEDEKALKLALEEPFDVELVKQWASEDKPQKTRMDHFVDWDALSDEEKRKEMDLQAKASHIERVLQNLRVKWPKPNGRMIRALNLIACMQDDTSVSLSHVHEEQIRVHTNKLHHPPEEVAAPK